MTSPEATIDAASVAIGGLRDAGSPRVHLALTGGGTGLVRTICAVPGISAFFHGASIPYQADAAQAFLGFAAERACAPETAVDLAQAAYLRAWQPDHPAIGLGLTAVIATLTPHRGDHRVHCATFSEAGCRVHSLVLSKGAGIAQREEDEQVCEALGLNALLAAAGQAPLPTPFKVDESDGAGLARERLLGRPLFTARGERRTGEGLTALFPGTFNPPHFGHFRLADALQRAIGQRPAFCLTLNPPHKTALTTAEALQRVKLLRGEDVLLSEGDPLYLDKARLHPGATFLMGLDAVERMLDPRWGPVLPMLAELERLGTRFFVVGRGAELDARGLEALSIPPKFRALFNALPGRYDVSSTALRQAGQA